MQNKQPPVYDETQITVLKGLEAVRVRPAMYIGDTDKKGLHHCLWEVLDNSVDEAMIGACTLINVIIHDDGETITVEDNGRGIPVGIHPDYVKEQKTALEIVLTVLHAGGKFHTDVVSGGLHGVGVSCVNALSDLLTATIWRDGGVFEQKFSKGLPITKCEKIGDSRKHGTSITFHADEEIFTNGIKFDEEIILKKLRQMAFLNAGLKITYDNKKTKFSESFQYDGGIQDYVKYQLSSKTGHYPEPPFYFKNSLGNIAVQVAFQYTDDDDESILTFANNINTPDGGTHLSGFKTALTRVVNNFARSLGMIKSNDNNLSGDDVREGITAIVSIQLPQPQFEGQTKAKLGTVEADGAVNTLLGEALTEFFEKNPAIAKTIIDRAQLSQKAREAAKKESDAIKRKSYLSKSNRLPGKLKDCDSENRDETELFICEGDSAAGAAKDGRNSRTQAVLPIRGKIINTEKNDTDSLMANTEIKSLISAIGTGIMKDSEDEFNIEDRRYNKIILMTDADVDGSHIATLLLTFFYKFMKPLITNGYIYLAQPPLYKIQMGKTLEYSWSDKDMDKITERYGKSKAEVTRFKGLGEMNSDELGDTTMNPANRKLIQVRIEDAADAEKMLSTLMGKNVSDRKAYIIEHSRTIKIKEELN